jgi:hypothetical protein
MNKFSARDNEWGKGFYITFDNGYTVSVQFGRGAYSDEGATTAEVGAWGPEPEHTWVKLSEYDNVKGHCTPSEVLEIMNKVANIKD